eukprot:COSAG01_NODE_8823_length_2648_cov_3.571989_1_plen_355_part_00
MRARARAAAAAAYVRARARRAGGASSRAMGLDGDGDGDEGDGGAPETCATEPVDWERQAKLLTRQLERQKTLVAALRVATSPPGAAAPVALRRLVPRGAREASHLAYDGRPYMYASKGEVMDWLKRPPGRAAVKSSGNKGRAPLSEPLSTLASTFDNVWTLLVRDMGPTATAQQVQLDSSSTSGSKTPTSGCWAEEVLSTTSPEEAHRLEKLRQDHPELWEHFETEWQSSTTAGGRTSKPDPEITRRVGRTGSRRRRTATTVAVSSAPRRSSRHATSDGSASRAPPPNSARQSSRSARQAWTRPTTAPAAAQQPTQQRNLSASDARGAVGRGRGRRPRSRSRRRPARHDGERFP